MSVMTKTTGQSRTPVVRLKPKPSVPNKRKLNGDMPKVASKEKIFTPMNSATMAFVMKNPPKMKSSIVGLCVNNFNFPLF